MDFKFGWGTTYMQYLTKDAYDTQGCAAYNRKYSRLVHEQSVKGDTECLSQMFPREPAEILYPGACIQRILYPRKP